MLATLNLRTSLALACATIAILVAGLGYLLFERRRLFLVQSELLHQHLRRLHTARLLQDSLLQCLHILVLRFHAAAENVRADDPAKGVILAELERADALVIGARTDVEDLTAGTDANNYSP